jgi:hypothetical protein
MANCGVRNGTAICLDSSIKVRLDTESGKQKEWSMKASVKFALCTALMIVALPALAMAKDKDNDRGDRDRDDRGQSTHSVPGPLVGAGLPFIAVGYGAYWLVRRYRRKSDAA